MDEASRELIKTLIVLGATAVVCGYWARQTRLSLTARRLLRVVLGLLAVGAVAGYFEFGWRRFGIYLNPHDFFHHYIATKYAREIGYQRQYRCALIADMEERRVFPLSSSIRNLKNDKFIAARAVLKHPNACKRRFTEERWREFKKDVLYFQSLVPRSKWKHMLRDKGYNGTPVWTMMTALWTTRVPTDSPLGMAFLACLDPILLGLMFTLIGLSFGIDALLLTVIFYGTNFTMSFVHIKGALLRLDWLVALVLCICLVKQKRYKLAGGCLAYAALMRIFPVIFAFGLLSVMAWQLLGRTFGAAASRIPGAGRCGRCPHR